MKLSKQVCSLELSQKLKTLGVEQESLYYWAEDVENAWVVTEDDWHVKAGLCYSAFTVAELGEMFPTGQFWKDESNPRVIRTFKAGMERGSWWCELAQGTEVYPAPMAKPIHREVENTEADARAKMLCYLLENKLI